MTSQKVQKRDLTLFRDFLLSECGSEERRFWTPRQSKAFKDSLKKLSLGQGRRGYGDLTINRIMAHLKTFAKWIHKLKPFPLDNPMAKLKLMPVGTGLEVERAITPAERRRILDAADNLPSVGGRSRDRHGEPGQESPRCADDERPARYRPQCRRSRSWRATSWISTPATYAWPRRWAGGSGGRKKGKKKKPNG